MIATTSADVFLARVLASRLLTEGLVRKVDPPSDGTAAGLARSLVRARLLTPFQAQSLLSEEPRAFFVADRYKLLEHLGQGGMGEVFMAEHLLLRRVVALKVISATDPQNQGQGAVERFFREARAVAALDHPNVVRVFDMDHTARGPFLVMEYVDGTNLHAVVAAAGPLSVGRAVDAARQAAAGLGHAHAAGLIHRDVKPANLLLDRTGTVKVVDLGLARYRDTSLNDGLTAKYDGSDVMMGTVDFAPPEQGLDPGTADTRSDVYGLGASLYFLLTGQVPYPNSSISSKLLAHQLKPPPDATRVNPAVPPELSRVVTRMMAKERSERLQTMDVVRVALEPWQPADLQPPPAAHLPKHPPASYRLGLCPPPSGSGAKGTQSDGPPTTPAAVVTPRHPPARVSGSHPSRQSSTADERTRALSPKRANAPPPSTPSTADERAPAPSPERAVAPPPSRRRLLFGLGVGALAVAAGGGGLGWYLTSGRRAEQTSAEPPPVVGVTLTGSGSSFVAPAMKAWAEQYRGLTGVTVRYDSIGSGLGVANLLAGTSNQFGCTESPVSDEQAKRAGKRLEDVAHIPLAFGAVVPIYHLPGVRGRVRFSPAALAGIYAGTVTRWNDPLLLQANPGVPLPPDAITVVHRSDSSGTTFVFQDYLCAAVPKFRAAVRGGKASTDWNWTTTPAVTVSDAKNDGVAKKVTQTEYAIGYVELGFALANGIDYGQVLNADGEFVDGSLAAVTAAAANKLKQKDGIPPDLRFSLVNADGKDSYPICSAVWAVLFRHQPGGRGEELVKFVRWVVHDGQRLLPDLRYAPMPDDLVRRVDRELAGITH